MWRSAGSIKRWKKSATQKRNGRSKHNKRQRTQEQSKTPAIRSWPEKGILSQPVLFARLLRIWQQAPVPLDWRTHTCGQQVGGNVMEELVITLRCTARDVHREKNSHRERISSKTTSTPAKPDVERCGGEPHLDLSAGAMMTICSRTSAMLKHATSFVSPLVEFVPKVVEDVGANVSTLVSGNLHIF